MDRSPISGKKNPTDDRVADRRPRPPVGMTACTVVLVAAWMLYAVCFYRQPLAAELSRGRVLVQLVLLPGEVIRSWTAGDPSATGVGDRLPVLAMAAAMLLSAWGWGTAALRLLRLDDAWLSWERSIFALGVGLPWISHMTLALGLAGRISRPVELALVVAGGWLAAGLTLRADRRRRGEELADRDRVAECAADVEAEVTERRGARWILLLAVPFVVLLVAGGLLPPIEFDVLEYHAQVPKEWFGQGRITFLPHNVYGNMPLGAEMLALASMMLWPGEDSWWWGMLTGKLLMASFGVLVAAAVASAGRRWLSSRAGAWAGVLVVSTPWVAVVSMNGLNDLVLTFYLALAFYAAALAHTVDIRVRPGMAFLTGWYVGAALSCKYSAALYGLVPLVGWFLVLGIQRAPRTALAGALGVVLAGSPWLVKNAALTGNPVYPLPVAGLSDRGPEPDDQWRRAHQVPRDAEGAAYTPAALIRAVANLGGRSIWHSPLLVPLACLAGLAAWKNPRWRKPLTAALLAILFVAGAWWIATHRIDRFWLPLLPFLGFLAGAGIVWCQDRTWRLTATTIACGLWWANLLLVASPAVADNRFLVKIESLRRDPDISLVRPAYRFLNREYGRRAAGQGGAVLLVGDARPLFLEPPVRYNTCFDDCVLERLTSDRDAEARRRALRDAGIEYVHFDWSEIRRYRATYGFTDYVTRERIQGEFVETGVLEPVTTVPLDPRREQLYRVRKVPLPEG